MAAQATDAITKTKLRPDPIDIPLILTDEVTKKSYIRSRNILGSGCYSVVVEVTPVDDSRGSAVLACKVLDKQKLSADDLLEALREAELLKQLDNPSIIKFVGAFEQDQFSLILLERCVYSLADLLHWRTQLTVPEIRYFGRQAVSGLNYLKCRGVIHRDIKPGNLLISNEMKLKIADFGLAKSYIKKMASRPRRIVGTPQFAAPEIFTGMPYSFGVDVWALGCSLYQASEGRVPFRPPAGVKASWGVMASILTTSDLTVEYSELGYKPLQNLLKVMLSRDPLRRIKIEHVLNHEFFSVGYTPPTLPEDLAIRIPLELVQLDAKAVAAIQCPSPIARPIWDLNISDLLETSEGAFVDPVEDTTTLCADVSSWGVAGYSPSSHSRPTTEQQSLSDFNPSTLLAQSSTNNQNQWVVANSAINSGSHSRSVMAVPELQAHPRPFAVPMAPGGFPFAPGAPRGFPWTPGVPSGFPFLNVPRGLPFISRSPGPSPATRPTSHSPLTDAGTRVFTTPWTGVHFAPNASASVHTPGFGVRVLSRGDTRFNVRYESIEYNKRTGQ